MIVYLNGDFVDESQAKISVFDRGFLFGEGVFETLRATAGHPFLEERHFQRLSKSAKLLGYKKEPDRKSWTKILSGLLEKNGLTEAMIRIILTRGQGIPGQLLPQQESLSWVGMARPFSGHPKKWFSEGVKVDIENQPTFRSGPSSAKTLDLSASIALRQNHPDVHEVLRLSAQGWIAEGTTSNVFWVSKGTLYTPHLETKILPGVTRSLVMELAPDIAGRPCQESKVPPKEILSAEEVFLTNSSSGILPVSEIGSKKIGPPGPMTLSFRASFEKMRPKGEDE